MKTLKSQSGVIDIVLILVVFILALGLGGYIYYQQRQANKAYSTAGSGVTVAKHAAVDSTAIRDNVKVFYADWLNPKATGSGVNPDDYVTKGFLTKKASAAIQAATQMDLPSCSQNALEPGQYTYTTPVIKGTTGTMTISGTYTGGSAPSINVIKLDLVKSGSNWLIDGFHCPTNDAQAAAQ